MTSQPYLPLTVENDGPGKVLRLPALEVRQGDGSTLYSFAVDGKQLPFFATISRIHRDDDAEIQGYQRPAVLSHINAIRRYIESDSPMIPNALVIAFDKRVQFEPLSGVPHAAYTRHGTITIPISEGEADEDKPGWIVDGQQRSAAIRDARVDSFPICVTAFIAESDEEQRSQFILVNSAKPLPKGLIYELLPGTIGTLPPQFQTREFPSRLLYRLNFMIDSPLYRLIQTPTNPDGKVKDNSILKMLENSLSDGALYFFRDPQTGECNEDAMLAVLKDFWRAVSRVFPEAWDKPPRQSRLMHGAGIVSLGFLMDTIFDRYIRVRVPAERDFARDLTPLKTVCRWTTGLWDFGPHSQPKWNELQNTTRDIQVLSEYLINEYKNRVWNTPLDEGGGQLTLCGHGGDPGWINRESPGPVKYAVAIRRRRVSVIRGRRVLSPRTEASGQVDWEGTADKVPIPCNGGGGGLVAWNMRIATGRPVGCWLGFLSSRLGRPVGMASSRRTQLQTLGQSQRRR